MYEQPKMVSDQDIAKGVETVLRQSDPNAVTTLNGVVQQLETQLGLDLSHKAGFIRDQISHLLRSHPQSHPQNDHFALNHHPQFPLQQQPELNFRQVQQQQQQQQPQPPAVSQTQRQPSFSKVELVAQNAVAQVVVSENAAAFAPKLEKLSVPAGTKRRGGGGGLNKVCGVSPELQAIVGEPALPRTEIVKQLWAYIRKHNLQDPSNKRKIICDDALRLLFETDCTDMFQMNKLLAKHIIRLEPTKEPVQAKRQKVDVIGSTTESDEPGQSPVIISEPVKSNVAISEPGQSPLIISEALAKFLGVGEREMLQSEALKGVWEYIKINHLEDPLNSMVILCDANLRELLGCESISALGVSEMLSRHHLFKQS